MSLVGSIFGGSEKKSADDASLTNLFDQSSTLPEKPQHTEAVSRKKKRKEAPVEPSPKKQRKAKKDDAPKEFSEDADDEQAASKEDSVEERTIFVGNLPLETTRKSLASLFKSCGKVESARLRSVAAAGVKLPTDRAGDQNLVKKVCANTHKLDKVKSTAQGYVVFASKESVEEALKLNNTVVQDDLRMRVDHATPTMDASRTVFCGNLPYKAEEATLQKHFVETCGLEDFNVEGVRIVRDKDTMQCKGFAYILFQDKSMVAVALRKMNDTLYMKRKLRVTVCGKRYKGRKGAAKEDSKRTFEGKRSDGAMKRILKKSTESSTKKRRARGEPKSSLSKVGPVKKAGVSKRAAAEAKVGKRMKKIQKRVSKGMGKGRSK